MILGYVRLPTSDQNLDGQRDSLREAGAGRLYANTIIGTCGSILRPISQPISRPDP